jgi:zinc protease
MRIQLALIAGALLSAGVAAPGGPVPGPAPRTFELKNGMRVTLIHTGTVRKAFVSLVLETGEIDEPAFGPGLAQLTADILLQGTVARSAQQIDGEAATLGTKIAVRAGPVTTTISGDVATASIPRFVSLVADLVRHPLLDTAGFERVRRNALRALDSTLHNAADLARQQWRAVIFPDGPFGHPYSFEATLRLLKLGHVRNVYDDNYSAARARLYVSGVFDDAATELTVRAIFSDWKAGTPPVPRAIRATAVHELVTSDVPGADRSVTWIGLPTIDPANPDFAKLEVADMLLSGDDSSRVSIDLASVEGAPQHGSSTIWQRRTATYWVDVLDVQTAHTGAALGSLIGELSVLRKDVPPEAEVARARQGVIAAFEARNDSREGAVALRMFMNEHSLGDDWLAAHAKRILRVTPDDVREAAAAYLDPERMAIAIAGDRRAIEPQLARLRPMVP